MTTLMVQTERLLHNYHTIAKHTGKKPVIPVLEGNAYGLGDVGVGQVLARAGVRTCAVSRLDEAERLVAAVPGVEVILLASYSTEEAAAHIVEAGITASIGSHESAVLLSGMARKRRKRIRVHIRFDTGLGRGGFAPGEAAKVARTLRNLDGLDICGVYAIPPPIGARSGAEQTKFKPFADAVKILAREKISPGIVHYADAVGGLLHPWMRLDAVRVGMSLLGSLPVKDRWGLKKVGRVVAEVSEVFWIPKGSSIGAERNKVRRATRAAVVPVGLADGLFVERQREHTGIGAALGNAAREMASIFQKNRPTCEVGGKRAPVLGIPGLTSMTLDVTDIPCAVGDLVYVDGNPLSINGVMRRDYV